MDGLARILENRMYSAADHDLISRAYEAAERAHKGQKRVSGHAYITHPLAVATYIAELGFDAQSVAAALMHDVLEDTGITKEDVRREFGDEVAFLVDGVTKLGAIQYTGSPGLAKSADPHVESLKKMFFAMAEDLRVIIIKLADRLHNMRTLAPLPPADRHRIALETLDIYAPIAARLGMGNLKGELEDLAFPYARPKEYERLMATMKDKYTDRLKYITRVAPIIRRHLMDADIPVLDIHARVKHHYSLWQKLHRYEMDPDRVMDLVAMRIIVPDIRSCYEALGTIHATYKPLPGRIKDFIAIPKPNGYRSLHTTVFCEKGRIAEIQIRTPEMHDHAENGVASHWAYSEQGKHRATFAKAAELAWINQLKATLKDIKSQQGVASLKMDFFKSRIFAFTPKGDVKDLPEGATPVDFAYAIHSDLGHAVQGAKINNKIVPLSTALANGDVVEIIKGNRIRPSWDWLESVRTSEAKRNIRGWFKRNDPTIATVNGRKLLNKELAKVHLSLEKLGREHTQVIMKMFSAKSLDDVLLQISMGDLEAADVVRNILPEAWRAAHSRKPEQRTKSRRIQNTVPTISGLLVGGQSGMAYKLGKCCSPARGQAVRGYITRAKGVTVHLVSCSNLKSADPARVIDAEWYAG